MLSLNFSTLIRNYFKPVNEINEATQSGVVLNTCPFCNVSTDNGFAMIWEVGYKEISETGGCICASI
jgi:hypothetical protein